VGGFFFWRRGFVACALLFFFVSWPWSPTFCCLLAPTLSIFTHISQEEECHSRLDRFFWFFWVCDERIYFSTLRSFKLRLFYFNFRTSFFYIDPPFFWELTLLPFLFPDFFCFFFLRLFLEAYSLVFLIVRSFFSDIFCLYLILHSDDRMGPRFFCSLSRLFGAFGGGA